MKNDLDSIEYIQQIYQAERKYLKYAFSNMRTAGYRFKCRITKRCCRANSPLRSKFSAERGVTMEFEDQHWEF